MEVAVWPVETQPCGGAAVVRLEVREVGAGTSERKERYITHGGCRPSDKAGRLSRRTDRFDRGAAKFIERHDGGFDLEGENLRGLLRRANTPASADEACQAFRQWAESCGLLSDAVVDSPP